MGKKGLLMASGEKEGIDLESSSRFRNFDWEKAKSFYYVAKCGSFAGAARFLNISQSALSRQVIYLEQQLGCPLFSRHSSGVTLTRKGKELTAIVEATFLSFKGFTRNADETSENEQRKIRICATHAVIAYILSELIVSYNKNHPHLIFELIGDDHLIDIALNDVDIAIRPYDPEMQGVQQEPLFTLEKKLYASPQYLEKYGEPRSVDDLKHHRLIAFGHPELHPYADVNWILKLGLPEGQFHKPVMTSTAVECLVKAAKNGLGIIASYEKMEIIKDSGLKNILTGVKDKKIEDYFIYPNFLKKDKEVIQLKNYLQQNLSL